MPNVDDILSPRFASDAEDDDPQTIENRKKVAEQLEKIEQWDAHGVVVDSRMMLGRKVNRGFTISCGGVPQPPPPEEGGEAEESEKKQEFKRAAARAQTMPASSTRRADFALSADIQKKMQDAQASLVARRRRGSAAVAFEQLKEDALQRFLEETSTCCVIGVMTEGQQHGDERERKFLVGSKMPGDLPPIVHCQKGSKGFRDTTPNQDNFSCTFYKNGITLVCTFDGHGPYGHYVSTRTVQTVPYFLAKSASFPHDMKTALVEAFEMSQKDVFALALEENWDVQTSGSTAVAVAWKGSTVWTANCGDSRCVIGSESDKSVVFETTDHKPDTPAEKARIEASGGEVRTQTYPDGWVNHRIFVKGEDYPGLCMARTLGDVCVKDHGVIATPEVVESTVDLKKQIFIICASDGVWEFLDSRFVVKAVAKKMATDGAEKTLTKLQREAKKCWNREEGDYCDDITSALIRLR
eukprot:TRINITY_DN122859_c0_g1_i1.p1 TRINITY_DN122859_c0_g1~~TRINITY_DN122859_c0_g1_i1.p1  ORF type:complete len:468 (+),score=127.86 TRINITY_DN122859_c0_g1_i1:104-1507(+)